MLTAPTTTRKIAPGWSHHPYSYVRIECLPLYVEAQSTFDNIHLDEQSWLVDFSFKRSDIPPLTTNPNAHTSYQITILQLALDNPS